MGRFADFFREQSITLAEQPKSKMLALDREFENLKAERDALKTQNLKLQAQVNPLQRDVERLKAEVEKKSAQESHKLDETSEKMLLQIANGVHDRDPLIAGLSRAKGEYHLDVLIRSGLIDHSSLGGMGSFYSATPEGRQYLADHDLL